MERDVSSFAEDGKTIVDFSIGIPRWESIQYVPSLWESAKFAWITYLAFLIPILYILFYGTLEIVIKDHIFPVTELNDLPKNVTNKFIY